MAFTRKSTSAKQRSGNTSLFIFHALATLALQATFMSATPLTEERLPHLCDAVRCPPLEDISCPADSEVRETLALALASSPATLTQAIAATPDTHYNDSSSSSYFADELYTQCCVAKKCLCRTCYIPECRREDEVIYELTPESMETPGRCCGSYECRSEPDCTEVRNTESYWLTNCQRCKCFSGERICHQSCDEGAKKSTAICNSKSLNRFFENGATWRYGCYDCECVNGEEKCVIPLCRSVNCPQERQVLLKNSCCPICWPANMTMPNAQDAEDDEGGQAPLLPLPELPDMSVYDEDVGAEDGKEADDNAGVAGAGVAPAAAAVDYADNELDLLPNLPLNSEENEKVATLALGITTTTSNRPVNTTTVAPFIVRHAVDPSTTTTTTTTTTSKPPSSHPAESSVSPESRTAFAPLTSTTTTTAAPCPARRAHEEPATYHVYPEVVEVVRQTQQNDLLYAVIGCLGLAVVLLVAWNVHLRAKQRSYRPVSHIDDNFNKMSSSMKKMNDYV